MQRWFHNVKNCREMRCLRHKIHIGLFVALIFTDLAWILAAFIQVVIAGILNLFTNPLSRIQTFIGGATEHPDYETIISVWCNINVVLRYFHLTTFFWMFLEGNKKELSLFSTLTFCLPEEIESFKLRKETASQTTDNISNQFFLS